MIDAVADCLQQLGLAQRRVGSADERTERTQDGVGLARPIEVDALEPGRQ